ncbi:MAG: barstar family protein [Acidimicrobiales bacterium]
MIEPIDALLTGWTAPGVWSIDTLPDDLAPRAEGLGWRPLVVEGEHASKESFLAAVREAATFPEWVGNNWDAFEEVMRDLSWLPSAPLLLVLTSPVPDTAVEILIDVARHWDRHQRRFAVVISGQSLGRAASELPQLDRLPVIGQSPPRRSSGQ